MPFAEMKLKGIEEAKRLVSPALHKAALSKAVFNTLQDARKEEINEMKEIFDRPTPFILRGLKVKVQGLEGDMGFETFPVGRSPSDIIAVHVEGGDRPMKRSEKYLRSYWIPGAGATVNQYGNVPGTLMSQILSYLGKFPEVGYKANITARSRKRKGGRLRTFFVVGPGNPGLHAGVWERKAGGKVKPILIFINNPKYGKRFRFYDVARKVILRNMQNRYNDALNEKTLGLVGR